MLVFVVWLGALIPSVGDYLRLFLIPGAAAHTPWGEWLDWQPAGESVQPVWVALTGRQDRVSFDLPLDGEVVVPYGWRQDGLSGQSVFQDSLVIRGESGTSVRSVLPGRVVQIDVRPEGSVLTIDHGSQMQTVYARCEQVFVKIGNRVKADELIARVGSSGELWFTVLTGGRPTDPLLRARSGVK
jgi:murein DD-endopeptidase MepM/ murein hydrolase activator NlpD